jgi:hypothetical protein
MEGSTAVGPEPEADGTEIEHVIEAEPARRMDLYESAAAQLDAEKIEAWRPDKEDVTRIVGEVLDVDLAVNVGGATCPIVLTVNTREVGLRRVWCWHTVLLREVIEARPQLGDVVGFAFGGRSKSASGREYVSYSVSIARDTDSGQREVDYNRLALEAAPQTDAFGDEEPLAKANADDSSAQLDRDDDLPF